MHQDQNDIITTHHCIDDCPVTDFVKDANLLLLTEQEAKEQDEYDTMQVAALEAYNKVITETGDVKFAEEVFLKIHHRFFSSKKQYIL